MLDSHFCEKLNKLAHYLLPQTIIHTLDSGLYVYVNKI